jgi:hypothetical protein
MKTSSSNIPAVCRKAGTNRGFSLHKSGLAAVAIAAMALGCPSCNLAPKYQRPPATVPAAFKEAPAAAGADEVGWKPANPRDDAVSANWWAIRI